MIPTQKNVHNFPNQLNSIFQFPQTMLPFNPLTAFQPLMQNKLTPFPLNNSFPNPLQPYTPNLYNTMSLIKLQQDLQSQLMNLYNSKLPKLGNLSPASQICQTPKTMISDSPPQNFKIEAKVEAETCLELPNDPDICLEAQIKYMIQFFVNRFGMATSQEITQAKQKYSSNPKLVKAFEALSSKYSTISKTREEMVKWIIRRSFKTSKKSIKKEDRNCKRGFLKDLCTRYFKETEGDSHGEEEDTTEFVDRMLPFRKNSKNKTMNTNFIIEIFQSDDFKADYKVFLKDFDEISENENAEKVKRFASLVVECAKKGDFTKVAKYKRVPWLKMWVQNTRKVAHELDEGDYEGKSSKKVKTSH